MLMLMLEETGERGRKKMGKNREWMGDPVALVLTECEKTGITNPIHRFRFAFSYLILRLSLTLFLLLPLFRSNGNPDSKPVLLRTPPSRSPTVVCSLMMLLFPPSSLIFVCLVVF